MTTMFGMSPLWAPVWSAVISMFARASVRIRLIGRLTPVDAVTRDGHLWKTERADVWTYKYVSIIMDHSHGA